MGWGGVEESVNRPLLREGGRGCGSPWEPEADRVVGLYLAPFSGILHAEQPSSAVQVGNRIQKKALACRAAAGGQSILLESVQEGGGLRGWSSTTLCPLALGATSEAWVDGRGGRRNA